MHNALIIKSLHLHCDLQVGTSSRVATTRVAVLQMSKNIQPPTARILSSQLPYSCGPPYVFNSLAAQLNSPVIRTDKRNKSTCSAPTCKPLPSLRDNLPIWASTLPAPAWCAWPSFWPLRWAPVIHIAGSSRKSEVMHCTGPMCCLCRNMLWTVLTGLTALITQTWMAQTAA